MDDLNTEIESWLDTLRQWLKEYGQSANADLTEARAALQHVERDIIEKHRDYNRKVLIGIEGYGERPFAIEAGRMAPAEYERLRTQGPRILPPKDDQRGAPRRSLRSAA